MQSLQKQNLTSRLNRAALVDEDDDDDDDDTTTPLYVATSCKTRSF
jgi:hypothetical protein